MRNLNTKFALGLLLIGGLVLGAGCTVDPPSAPEVPFSDEQIRVNRPVVSIGNSLTAGFQNSGLSVQGQAASFPNLLSQMIGGSPIAAPPVPQGPAVYTQMPIIANLHPTTGQPVGIGTTFTNGIPQSALFVELSGDEPRIATIPLNPAEIPGMLANAVYPLPYDNLGVPGAYIQDALVTTDATNSIKAGNLFYDLILRNAALPPGGTTQISQLEAHFTRETIVGVDPTTRELIYDIQIPPVVTLWLGGNDLLLGAGTGNPVIGGGNVTSVADFDASFVAIANEISRFAPNAQVAVGNTQTLLPAFTTVPTGVVIEGALFVPWLTEEENVQYLLLNTPGDLAAAGLPPLGPDYLPPPFGSGEFSVPGTLTLTADEYQLVLDTARGYNDVIERECTARGWAYVDVESEFSALPDDPRAPSSYTQLNRLYAWFDFLDESGQPGQDGIPEQNKFSAMTLDGVHPSEKGYARIANLFAEALNATYGESYGSVEEESVANIAGFEQVLAAPAGTVPVDAVNGIAFTPSAAEVLRASLVNER